MDILTLLIILILATYRLSWLIVAEDGPFDIALRTRSWLSNKLPENHWLIRGYNCILCVSFWLAWVISLPALSILPGAEFYIVSSLAVSGGVMVLHGALFS